MIYFWDYYLTLRHCGKKLDYLIEDKIVVVIGVTDFQHSQGLNEHSEFNSSFFLNNETGKRLT